MAFSEEWSAHEPERPSLEGACQLAGENKPKRSEVIIDWMLCSALYGFLTDVVSAWSARPYNGGEVAALVFSEGCGAHEPE